MSVENDYCVIGLGRFGTAVVKTLSDLGKNILAIDKKQENVNAVISYVKEGLILDATNKNVLEEAGVHKIKNIIIGVGTDIAASAIIALNILQLNQTYNKENDLMLIAKATADAHQKILEAVGVQNIIMPESDAGKKAAFHAVWRMDLDITPIDKNHSMLNFVLKNKDYTEKTLEELQIPEKLTINLIAIKRNGISLMATSKEKLKIGDELLVIGTNNKLQETYQVLGNSLPEEAMVSKKST